MKEKIIKRLIKHGSNKEDAIKMVNENYETAIKMFPDAKVAKIKEVITYISIWIT